MEEMSKYARKSLPMLDNAPVKAILARALEILQTEGNRDYMWGYEALARAAREQGYDFKNHHRAATLFVNACNSSEIKIQALVKAMKDLG